MSSAPSLAEIDVQTLSREDFAEIVWRELAAALTQRNHPYRVVTLATRGADDDAQVRSVVLRELDREMWVIGCHTDLRSPKVAQLRRDPRCSWLFYDRDMKLQVRVQARAQLHHDDDLAEQAWGRTVVSSRGSYMGALAPSSELAAGMSPAGAVVAGNPPDEGAAGRANFGLIRAQIDSLDCLYLSAAGHRRLRIRRGVGEAQLDWLAP